MTICVHAQNGNIKVQNYEAPATRYNGNGFIAHATLGPSLPPPVLGLDGPADDPLVDLASCAACDVTSQFANGDEAILNLGLGNAVRYGDRTYNTIGVDTNGYLVIGGGTSADNMCCPPQDMPDPARPNNVIAPYWTDLNFTAGGNMYVALFTCGGTPCAYEFEWKNVPIYGTTHTRTFAVWIRPTTS